MKPHNYSPAQPTLIALYGAVRHYRQQGTNVNGLKVGREIMLRVQREMGSLSLPYGTAVEGAIPGSKLKIDWLDGHTATMVQIRIVTPNDGWKTYHFEYGVDLPGGLDQAELKALAAKLDWLDEPLPATMTKPRGSGKHWLDR